MAATAFAHSAEAAPRKRQAYRSDRTVIVTHDENGRTRTRIVVTPRSYLDGGTEVLPGQRKFTDYAIPPFSRPTDVLGPRWTFDRQPLNPIWEQGWTRGWY